MRVIPLRNWKGSSFLRVYRVQSRAMRGAAAAQVTAAPRMDPGALAFYTRNGGDERIRELALEVERRRGTPRRCRPSRSGCATTTSTRCTPAIAADGNQLHHFLFESRKGYCSYFAFAMALMCRSVGIPARVAVGFLVARETEVLNFYEVRAFQAHAWVEVWFGDLGWIEFDPTSQELAPGENFAFFAGPDMERLSSLIGEILQNRQLPEDTPAERRRSAGRLPDRRRAGEGVPHPRPAVVPDPPGAVRAVTARDQAPSRVPAAARG